MKFMKFVKFVKSLDCSYDNRGPFLDNFQAFDKMVWCLKWNKLVYLEICL